MRVLLTSRGSSGHVTPLAPFGRACVRAGHEVLVAAQERFAENVERTGLPLAPLDGPPDEAWMPLMGEFAALGLEEANDRMVADFFAGLDTPAMLPGLRRVVEEFRPDLIVREIWEFASTIAAEERGIPIARVGLGLAALDELSVRVAAPVLDAARVAAGLPPDPAGERLRGMPYLTTLPAELEDQDVPPPPRVLRFRAGDVPDAAPDDEPLVYVSFGSVTAGPHLPFYPALYRAAIDALASLPARFLLTVGEPRDHAELGPLPANVRVERWTPQDEVLPRAAAVVTHGGHGSTLGALAHGVPLVVLPLFSIDQWINAAAVARSGAGVALDAERHTRGALGLPGEATMAALRPAVEHVLTDPGPRAQAARIAAAIRALPGIDHAPSALAALVS